MSARRIRRQSPSSLARVLVSTRRREMSNGRPGLRAGEDPPSPGPFDGVPGRAVSRLRSAPPPPPPVIGRLSGRLRRLRHGRRRVAVYRIPTCGRSRRRRRHPGRGRVTS